MLSSSECQKCGAEGPSGHDGLRLQRPLDNPVHDAHHPGWNHHSIIRGPLDNPGHHTHDPGHLLGDNDAVSESLGPECIVTVIGLHTGGQVALLLCQYQG